MKAVYTTRTEAGIGDRPFQATAEAAVRSACPNPTSHPHETIAALPYSSGTTGLPKGVMLSHRNLVANVYQTLRPRTRLPHHADQRLLCYLPLYHIYGLNVLLNPS